ncbi:MAG TPA: carboxypeptidase regulatory-like domain-containing protein [Candidatus Aquilonibacter sp.]|nr:carboxypeptidase regulatory-like domain-containing protein [Candidatus Aquilonibacter sp.]
MKRYSGFFVALVAALALWMVPQMRAQQTASVHGHVQNPAGQPVTTGTVEFSHDLSGGEWKGKKITNSFPLDSNGDYKGTDIAPGDYLVAVVTQGKSVDFQQVTLKAGDDKTVDFDMTRADYIAKLSPEERKQIEELKAKNAAAMSANMKIKNLNATLATVRADLKAAAPTKGDVSKDVTDMKSATEVMPDQSILWITYADTLAAQGDHLIKTDKDEATKDYDAAVDAYKKGAELDAASKKPVPADQAAAWNGAGNVLAKEGKIPDATAAFENAVKAEPQNAGMFYGNQAAVLFNAGQTDAAMAAADKAIAADPNRPDPYFIKGQALIAKSTFDSKTNKIIPPPGCVDAYQHYLSLAPNGPHAEAVKEVLASLGEKVDTSYRAGRKK